MGAYSDVLGETTFRGSGETIPTRIAKTRSETLPLIICEAGKNERDANE